MTVNNADILTGDSCHQFQVPAPSLAFHLPSTLNATLMNMNFGEVKITDSLSSADLNVTFAAFLFFFFPEMDSSRGLREC